MKEDDKAGMRNVKKLLDKREATDTAKVAKSCNSNLFHLLSSILNYQYKIPHICVISNQRLTYVGFCIMYRVSGKTNYTFRT